jgi:pyruvate formate lyase activating enzyme
MLLRAADVARAAGLRFVYAGNMPGQVGELEDTRCPSCSTLLVGRHGYLITDYQITSSGACPSCATPIPGRWSERFEPQVAAFPFSPRRGWRRDAR